MNYGFFFFLIGKIKKNSKKQTKKGNKISEQGNTKNKVIPVVQPELFYYISYEQTMSNVVLFKAICKSRINICNFLRTIYICFK